MFELNPPHKPLLAVNTTHKLTLSVPVPASSLVTFSLSVMLFDKVNIMLLIYSE